RSSSSTLMARERTRGLLFLPLRFGVVERSLDNRPRDERTVVEANLELRAGLGTVRRDEGEADDLVQRRAASDGGDAADDFLVLDNQLAFLRYLGCFGLLRQREAGEDPLERAGADDAQASLADEERLVVFDGPGHVGFIGIGEAVGVLADDDMGFFQPQDALGLHAEGADAVFF